MTDERRRTERRTDRDMNEQRRTDITGTPVQLRKLSTDFVKHYPALQAEGRDEAEGRETEGRGKIIDRRLSSVTVTGALLNKSSRHVAELSDLYTFSIVCNSVNRSFNFHPFITPRS